MSILQTDLKTGPVMGNKKFPMLMLSFLLMAALCLNAFRIYKTLYTSSKEMSWTEARLYCQKAYTDMVTLNMVDSLWLSEWLMKIHVRQVWIGLVRDPENESIWKWINLKTGEGISGDDVSQIIKWATGKQDCALVSKKNQVWHSVNCSQEHEFYCSAGDRIQYHDIAVDWHNAFRYCKHNFSDLATITKTNKGNLDKRGWIGLYREAGGTWKWIGDLPSDYRNFASDKTLNKDCATYSFADRSCKNHPCSRKFKTLCYGDNLVVVNENKTWEDALKYCWDMETPCVYSKGPCVYRHNLLSLASPSDYNYVRDRIYKATTDEVWMGLRFLGGTWRWVTGHRLEDEGMLPNCPSQWKHCGTLSKYETNNWIIRDCSERRNFICHRTRILVALVNNTKTEKQED